MSDSSKKVPRGRLRRLRQVAGASAHMGAAWVRAKLSGDAAESDVIAQQAAKRLVSTLGEMKGLALKAGQSMAMVADALPPDAHAMLTQLFSQAPTLPFDAMIAALETQLGQPYDTVFAHIEPVPLAAASLAQVHAARLRDGTSVVVKIQYPSVAQALEDDLRNVSTLGKLSQLGGELFDRQIYVEEMTREIANELDYTREAAAMEDYRAAVADNPGLVVPRNYPAYTRPGLLVLEHMQGPTLQAYCAAAATTPHAERVRVAEQLLSAICAPLVRHRLVHGDAHPGNFIVLADGRLGILDFGCMRRVSPEFIAGSVGTLQALLDDDPRRVVEQARAAGFTIDIPDEQAMDILPEMAHVSIGFLLAPYDWRADNTLQRLMALKRHSPLVLARLRPPPEALLVYRALAGVAYNLRRLQITADLTPLARSFLEPRH